MTRRTDNLRVVSLDDLDSPVALRGKVPISPRAADVVLHGREELRAALAGADERLVVIVGPCSVHDPAAALEYAGRLAGLREELGDRLLLIMRVYFEKPRTTVGWKGLINDPKLDGSCNMNVGLRMAREVLLGINELGVPCATEFLDPIAPQYISDLVTWAAIGARTTESQTHREMASGLSMPVGFKNSTDGDLQIALNAMVSSRQSHSFLGITPEGRTAVVRTGGNPDVHLVMRGGASPNYKKPHLAFAEASLSELEGFGERRSILVDCSHDNSGKDYRKQPAVFEYLLEYRANGNRSLLGVMLESNLVEGKQKLRPGMTYGQSLTDACIGWEETEALLRKAHERLA